MNDLEKAMERIRFLEGQLYRADKEIEMLMQHRETVEAFHRKNSERIHEHREFMQALSVRCPIVEGFMLTGDSPLKALFAGKSCPGGERWKEPR
jgi:hypothetical protein